MISFAQSIARAQSGFSSLALVLALSAHGQMPADSQGGNCSTLHATTQHPQLPAPVIAPAHYYAPDSVRGGTPFPVRISVWRAPCSGHPDDLKVWMKLSSTANDRNWTQMPIITLYQHGKRLGTIPSRISGPAWSMVISDLDDLPAPTYGISNASFSLVAREGIAFDPRAAFTLFIEPRNGLWGPQDVRIDVPDISKPGNLGLIPAIDTGLWWNPARPGWALLLDRNEREVVFASWLTFDDIGNSTWLVMPQGTADQDGVVTGDLYAPRGKPFSMAPGWSSPGADLGPRVGKSQLRFDDALSGSFTHEIDGVTRTEPITRLIIRNAAGNRCNFGGLWYDDTRDGWGVAREDGNSSAQCAEHFTLMTFDDLGKPVWYFGGLASNGQYTAGPPNWFSGISARYSNKDGALYRPRGTGYRSFSELPFSIGSPVGWAETRGLDVEKARADVRIGNFQQIIDIKRFRFEY
jgi:hypothetical protein